MQKDPFVTLGVDESVTQNELYEAYKAARAKWEDKRFSPGEVGTEACEKLDEIEEAYRDAQDVLSSRHFITTVQDKIDQADALIRNRRYDEAQAILDDVSEKTAEVHFLQSVIYYSKHRYNDAVAELKTAVSDEPNNTKYTNALKHMEEKIRTQEDGYARSNVYNYRDDGGNDRSYSNDADYRRGGRGITPCDCCTSLICADCCCECMGGDLISCC